MNIRKMLVSGALMASLFAANSNTFAASEGWSKSGNDWYFTQNGKTLKSQWYQDSGGTWYWLSESGKMVTDWQFINGKWYRFNDDGAMLSGWSWSGDSWYFLNSSGAMETNWFYTGGYWYYADNSGAMQRGVIKDSSNKYYLMWDSGEMRTGTFVAQGLVKSTNGSGAITDPSGLTPSNNPVTSSFVKEALQHNIMTKDAHASQSELNELHAKVNMREVNKEFLKLVNEERAKKGLPPFEYDDNLAQAAEFRARELANQHAITYKGVAHKRPHTTDKAWQTVFDEDLKFMGWDRSQLMLSENLAANVAHQTDYSTEHGYSLHEPKEMAKLAFDVWKNSKGHYAAMMSHGENWGGYAALGVYFSKDVYITKLDKIYDSNAIFSSMLMRYTK